MTLPYAARLVGLALASFFVLHAALGLAARALGRRWTDPRNSRRPARAAARLLWLRAAAAAGAGFVVAAVCLPSYWRWEPAARSEEVGAWFVVAALLGGAVCALAAARIAAALLELRRLGRACRGCGRRAQLWPGRRPLLVIASEERVLALVGLIRPRLVASTALLEALTPEQLAAAAAHEMAHRKAWDNWKRALWLALPDLLPGWSGFQELERQWRRLREWAADDAAACGNPQRALALAEALLAAGRRAGAAPARLASTLAGEGDEIAERVRRLLASPAPAARVPAAPGSLLPVWAAGGASLMAMAIAAWAAAPATLHFTFYLLERFVH